NGFSTPHSSIESSSSSPWKCNHCQTTLDPSLFSDIAANIIIFCPYCGQKIYRDEHIPYSKEELLSEHQKVMAKLNNKDPQSQATTSAPNKAHWGSEDF
ncbi:MAG: hypothetical protein ACTSVZ_13115, partial [Promethearchaeota archaeon]